MMSLSFAIKEAGKTPPRPYFDEMNGGDGQIRAGEQGRTSKGETDVLEQKQRGWHGEGNITGWLRLGDSLDLPE